ncbi:phosphatase PAP2 family protein [Taibaiella koreensis]|uniref:phosphatase PAP2 family protein n=1 Tax=Taibaiella koreensis TaxID=1268548 RepID=UPI000E59B6A4|nr:phosphatase PAP2 family protein [Taibaiella koreensis]
MAIRSATSEGFWPDLLQRLDAWDRALFVKVNVDWTGGLADAVMPILRDQRTWYPLYAFLIIYVIWRFRWKALPFILIAGLTVVLTDQVSSNFLKNYFDRVRPCSEPLLAGIMKLRIGRCPTSGSFTSSHAVNHFGLAAYVIFCLKPYFKKWRYLFWLWAAAICYAQVYVGVHYPGDVSCGALLGILLGGLMAWLFNRYFNFGKPLQKRKMIAKD